MQQRHLGTSGLSVSALALGTMGWGSEVSPDDARDLLRAYTDGGGTVLDTAAGYADGASEEIIGALLASDLPREDVVLVTKAGISRRSGERVVDTSRGSLMRQLDASLLRLGTDCVDLWLVHTWSEEAPLAETMSALEWAVSSGRAAYVGVSNYGGWQTARGYSLLEQSRVPLVANEVEYSLLERSAERDLVPAALALGVGLLAWAPLAGGVLTGKYQGGTPRNSRGATATGGSVVRHRGEHTTGVVEALRIAARGLGVTPTEAALAWVRDRPAVGSVVVGARTPSQLQTVVASDTLVLPGELVAALDDVSSSTQARSGSSTS